MKNFAVLLLLFFFTCCSGIPENPNASVGWGKAREVKLANSQSITYLIDPLIKQPSPLFEHAQKHCESHVKDAVPQPYEKEGVLTLAIFLCK